MHQETCDQAKKGGEDTVPCCNGVLKFQYVFLPTLDIRQIVLFIINYHHIILGAL